VQHFHGYKGKGGRLEIVHHVGSGSWSTVLLGMHYGQIEVLIYVHGILRFNDDNDERIFQFNPYFFIFQLIHICRFLPSKL
jgi:hypothetical protein